MQDLIRFFGRVRICFRIVFGFLVCSWVIADQWPVAPTTLSTPGIDASSPSVAINTQGTAIALWIENGVVVAKTALFNRPWPSSATILSGVGASNPQVVIDTVGNATASWLENGLVMTASQPFQGTWSASTILSGNNASLPNMTSDGNDNVAIAWIEGGFVKVVISSTLGIWPTTPITLSTSGSSSNAKVSIGDGGTVAVVWEDIGQTVYYSSSPLSGSWSTPQQISGLGVLTSQPCVAVDKVGDITVAWFSFNQTGTLYSNVVLQVTQLPQGGNWTLPLSIPPMGIKNPNALLLKLAAVDNYPTIIWTNSLDDSTFCSQYTVYQNGSWLSPITFDFADPCAYALDVGIDFRNTGYFVWMASDLVSSSILMYGMLQDVTGIYTPFVPAWTLSEEGNNGYPVVGVCRQGPMPYGIAAWLNNSGDHTNVQALVSAFPFTKPISNLTVTRKNQNLGITQMPYNLLTWSASPSLSPTKYLVFRNGLLIDAVSATFLEYRDLNRGTPESSTYSVYTVGKSGMISAPVTVAFTYP